MAPLALRRCRVLLIFRKINELRHSPKQAHSFVESVSRRMKNFQRNQQNLQSATASDQETLVLRSGHAVHIWGERIGTMAIWHPSPHIRQIKPLPAKGEVPATQRDHEPKRSTKAKKDRG